MNGTSHCAAKVAAGSFRPCLRQLYLDSKRGVVDERFNKGCQLNSLVEKAKYSRWSWRLAWWYFFCGHLVQLNDHPRARVWCFYQEKRQACQNGELYIRTTIDTRVCPLHHDTSSVLIVYKAVAALRVSTIHDNPWSWMENNSWPCRCTLLRLDIPGISSLLFETVGKPFLTPGD